MAKLKFNAATAKPMEERTLVPEGDYLASIIKSELVPTKAKTGTRLNFTFKILGGEFKGNQLFVGLNYENPNPVAVQISEQELKSICDAAGKGQEELTDTEILHGIPIVVSVEHAPPTGEYIEDGETKYRYKAKAEIKGYATAEGSDLVNESTDSAPASKAPPWAKKEEASAE